MEEPQRNQLIQVLSQSIENILGRPEALTRTTRAIRWWQARTPQQKKLLLGLGVGMALIVAILAVWKIPQWQLAPLKAKIQRERNSLQPQDRLKLEYDARKLENDARTTLLQAVGGLALLIGLYFTAKTWRTTQEGQVTDRFTKAINQIGEGGPEKLALRLGGIYALERIARESKRDYGPMMEILTAYVREHAPWPPSISKPEGEPDQEPKTAADIEAILTVLGRHSPPLYRLDDIAGADMAAKMANLMVIIPSTGAVIDARAFIGIQNNTTTITITKPCEILLGNVDIRSSAAEIIAITNPGNSVTLRGAGRAFTYVNLMTTTQRGICVRSNQAVSILDMAIQQNTVAVDGSCAIYLDGATHTVTSGQSVVLQELHLPNHWDAIYIDASAYFLIDRCTFVNPLRSGVNLRNLVNPDEGDSTITRCLFTEGGGGTNYAIFQESSGGLRITNNKILGFAYAYALDIKGTTGVLVFGDNSVEGQRTAGLLFTRSSGSAFFGTITITGNEFGVGCPAVNVDTPGTVDVFHSGVIAGNAIATSLTSGSVLRFANGKVWSVYGNFIGAFGGTSIGIDIGFSTERIFLGQNTFNTVTTPINNNGTNTVIHPHGDVGTLIDGACGLYIQRNIGGTVTLQQVFMGAPDSGSPGFRALIVAN
jgi:Right handed beta helix region